MHNMLASLVRARTVVVARIIYNITYTTSRNYI